MTQQHVIDTIERLLSVYDDDAALTLELRERVFQEVRALMSERPQYSTYDGVWTLVGGERVQNTHGAHSCIQGYCTIHNPSDHALRSFRMHFREDNGLMERICNHGIGHPDPDDPQAPGYIHGCDGCCGS